MSRRLSRAPDYGGAIALLQVVYLVVVVVGIVAVGVHLLRKQQRIYREAEGPQDLFRADDLETGKTFDPGDGSRTAVDFFAGGARAQWMRGAADANFSPDAAHAPEPYKGPPRADGGQWMINEHEGWCPDPFGRHENRWISNGAPTSLVRDGAVESRDDPPPP